MIEKLRRQKKYGFTSLLTLDAFIETLRCKMPSWCRFVTLVIKKPLRTVIYVLALFFESGWSPYGLKRYPDHVELQKLYDSVEILELWKLPGDTAGDAQ